MPSTARRVSAFALLLGVRVVGAVALTELLSWGLEIAFAPLGALALCGCVLVGAAVSLLALTKVLGVPRARAGLVIDQRFLQELPVAAIVAFCWVGLAMLTLSVTGAGALEGNDKMPHPAMIASGFFACVFLAAFLQLTQSGLVVALAGERPIPPALLAVPTTVAVLGVLPFTQAPIVLANTALLSLSTTLLFVREDRREHAIPIGFAAGWMFVLVFVTGSPWLGLPHALGLLRWPTEASLITGGPHGFEGGLVCTFVLAILVGALIRARFLPPDGAEKPKEPPSQPEPPA